jgi:hypothetical protein
LNVVLEIKKVSNKQKIVQLKKIYIHLIQKSVNQIKKIIEIKVSKTNSEIKSQSYSWKI